MKAGIANDSSIGGSTCDHAQGRKFSLRKYEVCVPTSTDLGMEWATCTLLVIYLGSAQISVDIGVHLGGRQAECG